MNEATRIPPAALELGAGPEEFQNLHELIRKARSNLNQNSWDYIVGASETETTMRRNRMASSAHTTSATNASAPAPMAIIPAVSELTAPKDS